MRILAPFIVAGLALSAPALASAQSSSTAAPESTRSVTSSTTPPAVTTSQAPSATASGENTTATANLAVTVGEPVKDNTGATIGSVTSLATSNGQPTAVIKMGSDSFQVPTDRLGSENGAATINMTQAQIEKMLHPAAGGR